jgi:hypothetical protein
MAPLHSLVVATSLAIAWDSRGITEQVVRTTSLTLLLGWPLAPSLLRMLSRLAPTKEQLAYTGSRPLRYLMWLAWGALAACGARRLGRALRVVPDGLARIPSPTWSQKLYLLMATIGTALPLALSIAVGLSAFLRIADAVGRVVALGALLLWPLGPSLQTAFSQDPVRQQGRLGRFRRRVFCSRVPPVPPCEDDGCPICWEPFERPAEWHLPWASGHATEHCRWGCGRAVHAACMHSWMAGAAEGASGCPLCRAQWH